MAAKSPTSLNTSRNIALAKGVDHSKLSTVQAAAIEAQKIPSVQSQGEGFSIALKG